MTTTFPVVYSKLATDALIAQVLSQYEIEAVVNCCFWHRGLSDVYLVETIAKQYILRVSHCHWRSQADVQFELDLLDFLAQQGFPVAFPLHTQDGQLAIEINALEGKRYAALFIYAPGRVAVGDLNQEQAWLLGQTVANMHHLTQEFQSQFVRQPLTLEYLLDDSLAAIAPFLQRQPANWAYVTEAIEAIKVQISRFPQEAPFWGICWGDPHSGNVHFTEANQLTLFDFDQCGYGWRSFEIAKFLQVSMMSGLPLKVRKAFTMGYESIAPLMEFEYTALQALTQMALIWAWAISVNQATFYNYSRLDESYFQQWLAQLRLLRSPDWQLF